MGGTRSKEALKAGGSSNEPLWVVLVLFNPASFRRRAELFGQTVNHVLGFKDVRLVTVELTFHGADSVTKQLHAQCAKGLRTRWTDHLCFDSSDVFWAKENLLSLGVAAAKARGARAVAWVDADITFQDQHWAKKTLSALKEHAFVQPWSTADLRGPPTKSGKNGPVTATVTSFAAQLAAGKSYTARRNSEKDYWHPGFAWAARVDAFEAVGGLLTTTLGNADQHLAMSFLGRAEETVPKEPASASDGGTLAPGYLALVLEQQEAVKSNGFTLGVVKGNITHAWHGSLKNRKYKERWTVLKTHGYGPHFMKARDDHILTWTDAASEAFKKDVEAYFAERNEDATEDDDHPGAKKPHPQKKQGPRAKKSAGKIPKKQDPKGKGKAKGDDGDDGGDDDADDGGGDDGGDNVGGSDGISSGGNSNSGGNGSDNDSSSGGDDGGCDDGGRDDGGRDFGGYA